jgi:hypothetical protein
MSDYLTNLVRRSFAPVAAIQPRGIDSFEPQAFQDPLAADAVQGAEESAEAYEAAPPVKRGPRVETMEAAIDIVPPFNEAPRDQTKHMSVESQAPQASAREVVTPRQKAPAEVHSERVVSANPIADGEAKSTPPQRASVADDPLVAKPLRPSRATPDTTLQPSPRSSPESSPQPSPTPLREERLEVVSSTPEPFAESRPEPKAVRSTPAASQKKGDSSLRPAPLDPIHSTRQLLKRAAKAVSLSPQKVVAHLPPGRFEEAETTQVSPVSQTAVVQSPNTPVHDRGEATPTLTTLVPKPSTERFLTQSVRKRPNLQFSNPPDETPSENSNTETIINVAIGRIEVRATSAPGRSERQRSGPRVMKLDDYLQQRSRGSR